MSNAILNFCPHCGHLKCFHKIENNIVCDDCGFSMDKANLYAEDEDLLNAYAKSGLLSDTSK